MDDELQKELRACFLEEAADLLAKAEQAFLQLETNREDPSIIEQLFRIAHNLKGSARAVGLIEMGEFTHTLESLLLKIKNKELLLSVEVVNLLLRCNDFLSIVVEALKSGGPEATDHALIEEIKTAIAGNVAPTSTAQEVQPTPQHAVPEEATAAATEPSNASVPEATLMETPSTLVITENEGAEPAKLEPVVTLPAAQATPKPFPNKPAISGAVQDESIRVSLRRLEVLVNNIGELVILQTVLNQQKHLIPSQLLQKTIAQLSKITKDIQDISMGLRMVPLKQTFQKMQRIVRDTSKSLNKEVIFETGGEDTELDKTVVDMLGDPLVHLIRNAVDHGLESSEDRATAGKQPAGRVSLTAGHRGGKIVIEVKDDGKGLNAAKLREKAISKKLISPSQNLSEQDCFNLIFAPGFSTKEVVTDISGRGVGLDVVKTNIERVLQGEVQLDSQLGKGSCFRIILPLTLAIIDGMIVKSGNEIYVVPLTHVYESVKPKPQDIHHLSGVGDVLCLRGENLTTHRLNALLGVKTKGSSNEETAIVVRTGQSPFAIVVDEIIGRQQVVIKKLGDETRSLRGITGGAILGNGSAALILDLNDLVSKASTNQSPKMRGAA